MTTESAEKSDNEFYSDAANYWSEIPATIDGMLGGFGFISQTDIRGSKMLLKQLFNTRNPPGRQYALDCGAGIGRITKFLLTDIFENVDLVEQNPLFLEQAKKYMGSKRIKIGNYYPEGLQNFHPEPKKYDIIWIQWVLGHLTDIDLINFLISCQEGLKLNGMIVVKENLTSSEEIEMDRQDSSVTRPMWLLKRIFDKANLVCFREMKQHNFPKGLYSVYMFALKPQDRSANFKGDLNISSTPRDMNTESNFENEIRNLTDEEIRENEIKNVTDKSTPEKEINNLTDENIPTPQELQSSEDAKEYNKESAVENNLEVSL